MTKQEVLQKCTVLGNVIKLPTEQLDRKLYGEVKLALEKIGGKWKVGKVFGFEFEQNPTELLSQLADGEKINLKKEFQFFPTPDDIADKLVDLADLNEDDIILEPSAGRGAIVNAINRVLKNKQVFCFELMPLNMDYLKKIDTVTVLGEDFLDEKYQSLLKKYSFDKIVANPPFSKNQDIDHVYKMYEYLNTGGRLVSVTYKHWQISNNKKETEFREWLKKVGAEVIELKEGAFKKSGTNASTLIIVINKK